jgi:sugar phosphate isomerase/epimerase
MKRNQIAAQLYTLREFSKTAEDLENTLKKVKAIGYDAVQVSGIGPIEPERVKEMTERIGLQICATHIPYDRFVNDLDGVIQQHKLWNCRYAGLGSMPGQYRTGRDGYAALAREFTEIGKKLEDAGLKFIYHNHKFEFEKFDGKTGMEIMLQESGPSFGFELDMYWVQAGGANPTEWVRKVEGRMNVIHLKDMAIIKNEQVFAEIGQGNLNWHDIIQACRDTGVEWYVVEQDTCQRDPFESLEISYNYLTSML